MLGMFGNLVCISIHNDLVSRNSDFHSSHKEAEAQ